MTAHPAYRTRALLTENPEDDLRLHHVFWVFRKSYDAEKAAQGLGDIEKHEIDSCLVLRGEAFDLTAAQAVEKLAELEKAEIARGGKIEEDAETADDDSWPRKKLGRDFANAVHFGRYDEILHQAREELGRQASVLEQDIILPPSPVIRARAPRQ